MPCQREGRPRRGSNPEPSAWAAFLLIALPLVCGTTIIVDPNSSQSLCQVCTCRKFVEPSGGPFGSRSPQRPPPLLRTVVNCDCSAGNVRKISAFSRNFETTDHRCIKFMAFLFGVASRLVVFCHLTYTCCLIIRLMAYLRRTIYMHMYVLDELHD